MEEIVTTKLSTYLEAVRQRAEKATPGPLTVYSKSDNRQTVYRLTDLDQDDIAIFKHMNNASRDWKARVQNNVDFSAHARTDIPRLLAVIDVLMEGLSSIKSCGGPECSLCHHDYDHYEWCPEVIARETLQKAEEIVK
jgi:hypothetical protein